MWITTRVRAMETKLLPEAKEPQLIIVLEDADGAWHDGRGHVIDRATVGPMVRVIVLRQRVDGPA
jgi:hypothetical protein